MPGSKRCKDPPRNEDEPSRDTEDPSEIAKDLGNAQGGLGEMAREYKREGGVLDQMRTGDQWATSLPTGAGLWRRCGHRSTRCYGGDQRHRRREHAGPNSFGHTAIVLHCYLSRMPTMNDEVTVRDAVAGDATGICTIYNEAIAERSSTFETAPRSVADFHARIGDARFPLLVGVAEERVLGWAGLASYSSRACYAGIAEASVYVDSGARGRGIGTALTEALAATAEGRGFHKLMGKLFTDNFASIRLVERCGFRRVGIHRRHGQFVVPRGRSRCRRDRGGYLPVRSTPRRVSELP